MSFKAVEWALAQQIDRSSAKFVLVALASCVNSKSEAMVCHPSTAHLCAVTSQDRKTVMANIKVLKDLGFVTNTGERAGRTGQIAVFELNSTAFGTLASAASRENNDTKSGTVDDADNSAENGTVEEAQKRDSPKNGTLPFFPANSTVFPVEEYRFSHVRGPKTGHGTRKEQGKEQGRNREKKGAAFDPLSVELPDWLPVAAWSMWVRDRADRKKPVTAAAAKLQFRGLDRAREAGHDPALIIEKAIEQGWQGLYPAKDGSTLSRSANSSCAGASATPEWCRSAGFENVYEAANSGCWEHTATQFRRGMRLAEGVSA